MNLLLSNRNLKKITVAYAMVAIILVVAGVASAQDDLEAGGLTPEQEQEIDYADRLLDAGLPDYAEAVLTKLDLPPEMMDIRRIRSLTALGKFDEARAIVDANRDTTQSAFTLKLTLADGYYAWGRYDEAKALYEEFFNRFPEGPEPALKSFYLSSAYKYAQMMLLLNDQEAAAEAYRMALRANPERSTQRMLQSELAELILRMAREMDDSPQRQALIAEVQQIIDEILWVQDVWFGRAIVMMAHIRMMNDDVDGAMLLVDDYTDQLKAIDRALREQSTPEEDLTKLSPMAQCRYMIGSIMYDKALEELEAGNSQEALDMLIGRETHGGRRSSGAVQHFLNVFIRYPNTSWAPEAGNKFYKAEDLLKREWDKEIKANITDEQWQAVETAQFREARALFNQQRFGEAVDSYLQVLSLFPEKETSVQAMGELAACYIEVGETNYADTVIRHIAERFNKRQDLMVEAGNQVIRVAFKYAEFNKPEKMQETYGVFFNYFENHPRTVLELQRFARSAQAEGRYDDSLRYYGMIIRNHRESDAFFDALNGVAMVYNAQGDQRRQAQILNQLVKALTEAGKKNHLLINANYRLAMLMRDMGGRFAIEATKRFGEIEDLLKDGDTRMLYAETPEEAEANERLLQAAMFYQAMANATLQEVPANIQAAFNRRAKREVPPAVILQRFFKPNAIKKLLELVELFPESDFAPAALSQAGTLYTIVEKPDEARQVLQRLQREYPDSNEAANSVFMIGRNLLEMGMREEALEYFKQMFAGGGEYSAGQILTAGQELLKADEHAMAIAAFDRVIAMTNERRVLEPARVGKGEALLALEEYEAAAEWLDDVLEDYPKSGFTITICQAASEANAAVASQTEDDEQRLLLFNKAVGLMNRARQFAQDVPTQTRLDLAVARLNKRKAEAERQFGDRARADEYRNEAVAAYQTVIMFRDATDPEVAPYVETAYANALPLMVEMERWQDVLDDGERYLELFPRGSNVLGVRQAINTARINFGQSGE